MRYSTVKQHTRRKKKGKSLVHKYRRRKSVARAWPVKTPKMQDIDVWMKQSEAQKIPAGTVDIDEFMNNLQKEYVEGINKGRTPMMLTTSVPPPTSISRPTDPVDIWGGMRPEEIEASRKKLSSLTVHPAPVTFSVGDNINKIRDKLRYDINWYNSNILRRADQTHNPRIIRAIGEMERSRDKRIEQLKSLEH